MKIYVVFGLVCLGFNTVQGYLQYNPKLDDPENIPEVDVENYEPGVPADIHQHQLVPQLIAQLIAQLQAIQPRPYPAVPQATRTGRQDISGSNNRNNNNINIFNIVQTCIQLLRQTNAGQISSPFDIQSINNQNANLLKANAFLKGQLAHSHAVLNSEMLSQAKARTGRLTIIGNNNAGCNNDNNSNEGTCDSCLKNFNNCISRNCNSNSNTNSNVNDNNVKTCNLCPRNCWRTGRLTIIGSGNVGNIEDNNVVTCDWCLRNC